MSLSFRSGTRTSLEAHPIVADPNIPRFDIIDNLLDLHLCAAIYVIAVAVRVLTGS
jgi:hypothetical protein